MDIVATRLFAQHIDGLLRRRQVGAADSQADDVLALCIHLCHLLQLPAEVVFADARQAVGRLYLKLWILLLHILLIF